MPEFPLIVMKVAAVLLPVLLWIRTGRSPIVWAIYALLWAEAVLQQGWRTAALAGRMFMRALPSRVAAVRREVLEG